MNGRLEMVRQFADIAFTPSVKAMQQKHGSRIQYARMTSHAAEAALGQGERDFLANADTFYLASVTETAGPTCSIAAARPASSVCARHRR